MASCITQNDLTTAVDTTAHLLKPVSQVAADWKAQRCLILQAFWVLFYSGWYKAHSVSIMVITGKSHCLSPINRAAMPLRWP